MTRLTQDFRQTVKARLDSDPEFKAAMIQEIELLESEGKPYTAEYVKQLMASAKQAT